MTGINRVGQKVICVVEIEIETPRGEVYLGPLPVLDEVYTVTGFAETGMRAAVTMDANLDVGITVAEIPTLRGRHRKTGAWIDLAWPIMLFRPVDERQTDISDLVKIGFGALAQETEEA